MSSIKPILHASRIDLPANVRSKIVEILNDTLASTLDLKTQVKQAHWNVKGMDFYQLHELFDEMATELEEFTDLFAERITALAGTPFGTVRVAAENSAIPEYPLDIFDGKSHIIALADRYGAYAKIVRDGIAETDDLGDADTADLYTEVSREIDKRLWFLEAHLHSETPIVSTNGTAKASKNGSEPEPKSTNGKKSKSKK